MARGMGQHKKIVEYWAGKVYEGDIAIDWADQPDKRCWRCAEIHATPLERCHIVPRQLGGSDDVSNLVLLCGPCHKEAPDCDDSQAMWDWIKYTKSDAYGTFWLKRALNEAVMMNGNRQLDSAKFDGAKMMAALKKIGSHSLQISDSSFGWVILQACKI